jgi:hypothetical protein
VQSTADFSSVIIVMPEPIYQLWKAQHVSNLLVGSHKKGDPTPSSLKSCGVERGKLPDRHRLVVPQHRS